MNTGTYELSEPTILMNDIEYRTLKEEIFFKVKNILSALKDIFQVGVTTGIFCGGVIITLTLIVKFLVWII